MSSQGRTTISPKLAKARVSSTEFMEIGSSGLAQNGGEIREEFLRQLQGKQAYANYREMADNDPVIGAMLTSIEMIVRSVDWSVEPADSADEAAVKEAEFISGCLNDMSTSWADFLATVMGFLVYGYSYHEIVYKYRRGRSDDPRTNSRYNDGRIGWRKLPVRNQESIERWELDNNGGIQGAYQLDTYSSNR